MRIAVISEEDVADISKVIAKGIVKYIRDHPKATDQIIADVIQSGLEGFIAGKIDDLNNREMEMEDD